jgi:hypothetical protein
VVAKSSDARDQRRDLVTHVREIILPTLTLAQAGWNTKRQRAVEVSRLVFSCILRPALNSGVRRVARGQPRRGPATIHRRLESERCVRGGDVTWVAAQGE